MKFDVRLENEREVYRELESMALEAGVKAGEFADYVTTVGVKSLVRRTQPFGLAGKSRGKGESAIMGDLGNAFKVVSDSSRSTHVIRTLSGAAGHHRSVRGADGRVRNGVVKRLLARSVYLAYREKLRVRVGMAKGSFAPAARRLSGLKFQKWIMRHTVGGDARRTGRLGNVVWHLDAHPDHISRDRVMGVRGVHEVFRKHGNQVRRSLQGKLRRMGKRWERKLNS